MKSAFFIAVLSILCSCSGEADSGWPGTFRSENSRVVVLNPGQPVFRSNDQKFRWSQSLKIGSATDPDDALDFVFDVQADTKGNIYLLEKWGIKKYDSTGSFLQTNVYVCAYHNQNIIHKFSPNGDSLLSFASYANFINDRNYFLFDGKITVDKKNRVYLASSSKYAIQIFSDSGELTRTIQVENKAFAVPNFKRSGNRFQSNQTVFVTGLFVDARGRIFHQYWHKANNEFILDIFSPEGIFLYSDKQRIELNPSLKGFLADVRNGACYFFRTRPYSFVRRYNFALSEYHAPSFFSVEK